MDTFLISSITEKLNILQSNINNIRETTRTNWVAAREAQSTADGAASAASAAQSTADGAVSAVSAVTADGAAQSTADGAVTAANTAQSTADGAVTAANTAQSTADGHTAAIAANTAKASCPAWVPAADPGYPVYTVATGSTDFVNMVTFAPNNIVASNSTLPIKMFSNTTSGTNYLEVKNRDTNNVLIGDPNNAEGTDNVEITFTLPIPISGVTKIVVGTGAAYLASINGGAFSDLSGTSSHIAVNTLYDSTTTISLRSIAIKRIVTGFGATVRWNYIKVNDVLLVDGVTPPGLTYSEPYIANAVPSATAAAIAANTAAIAAKVTSPVWVPTLDPGYASYTVVNGATDFENMVTYSSNVTLPNPSASTLKMFDNTTSGGSYAEFSNSVADGNDNIEVTFTLVTPITEVTKIVVGTGYAYLASINGGAFSNVADSGFPRHNTLYDSTTPINLTSITLKRTLNNQTGGMFWSYIKVNDVLLVRNQRPVGLNYVIDTYIDNALPSATTAAIAANTAKLSCPAWVPAADPGYLTAIPSNITSDLNVNAGHGVLTGGANHAVTFSSGATQQFNNVFRANGNNRVAAFVPDVNSRGASVWWTNISQAAIGAIDGVLGGGLSFWANNGSAWINGMNIGSTGLVTKPNGIVAFKANLGAAITYPGGQWSTIKYNINVEQRGTSYNSTTGAFVAPVDGWYQFNAHITFNNSSGEYDGTFALFINNEYNDLIASASMPDTGLKDARTLSGCGYLDAGQAVNVKVYLTHNATTRNNSQHVGYFSGFLIG